MKQLATLSLLIASNGLFAQDCLHTVHPSLMPDWSWGWNSAKIQPSGNVSWNEWTLGMSYGVMAPDGQSQWDRRIVHMNPASWLSPDGACPRADGGQYIQGWIEFWGSFYTPCIVSTGPSGSPEWGRMYMTDSTEYGMSGCFFSRMAERPDGNMLVTTTSRKTPGLALLDPGGVPIWNKRYETEFPDSASYAIDAILEPDGSAIVLAQGAGGSLVIFKADSDGEPLWGYRYPLQMAHHPVDLLRAADGSYYVTTSTSTSWVNSGGLIHLNNDGTMDWMKSYDRRFGNAERLLGGDLLVSTSIAEPSDTAQLVRLDPSGNAIGAWTSTISGQHSLIGVRGDSVYVMHYADPDGIMGWTGLTVAVSPDDLSCAFSPVAPPTVTVETPPTTTGNIINALDDELKSWTMNIGISQGPGDLDIEAAVSSGPARPGFGYIVYTNAINLGGATSGPLMRTLTFDPVLTYVNAYPTPTSVVGNVITWTGTDALLSYDVDWAYAQFDIPADPLLIGTTLTNTLSVSQDSTETDLINNSTTATTFITGSYDPNDKHVLPRDFYHIENDSILDYTIQFQNTGNDTAFTVVVIDTLPLAVDTRTFEIGAASHPYTCSLTGNGILTFTFNDILLPDSNTNEPLSHGLVNFRIKPLPLTLGQEISNAADIYFDFNAPVRTPDATVVVTDQTGVRPVVKPSQLAVFPVPAKNTVTAMLPDGFTPVSAFAIGADGRRVPLFKPNTLERRSEYNVQHLAPGGYVLTLIDRNGKRMNARFTKE